MIRLKRCLKIVVLTIVANAINCDYFNATILVREDFEKKNKNVFGTYSGPYFAILEPNNDKK